MSSRPDVFECVYIDDGEPTEEQEPWKTGKDAILFAIDFHPSMHDPIDTRPYETAFKTCLGAICRTYRDKIIQSPSDLMGFMLFATEGTDNDWFVPHVVVLNALETPTVECLKHLDSAYDDPGALVQENGATRDSFPVSEILQVVSGVFRSVKTKLRRKRVFLMTCRDEITPQDEGDIGANDATGVILDDLREQDVEITLLPIDEKGAFDTSRFWRRIVNDETSICDVRNLGPTLRMLESKHRPIFSGAISLGDCRIGFKGFPIMATLKRKPHVYVENAAHDLVETSVNYICRKTGVRLESRDIRCGYKIGGETVLFTHDEIERMRDFGENCGIDILAFAQAKELQDTWLAEPGILVRPDNANYTGSNEALYDLITEMHDFGKLAICKVCARRNMVPRLAALVPSFGEQQGLWLHFLPFSDDLRHFEDQVYEEPDSFLSREAGMVTKRLVELMTPKMTFVRNQPLARFFERFEDLALHTELSSDSEIGEDVASVYDPELYQGHRSAEAAARALSVFATNYGFDMAGVANLGNNRKRPLKEVDNGALETSIETEPDHTSVGEEGETTGKKSYKSARADDKKGT